MTTLGLLFADVVMSAVIVCAVWFAVALIRDRDGWRSYKNGGYRNLTVIALAVDLAVIGFVGWVLCLKMV